GGPSSVVGALSPGMLRLVGREGAGGISCWFSADGGKQVVPHVGEGKEVGARIFIYPSEDTATVRAVGRHAVAAFLNVPVYRAFHEWLGRGPDLQPMWDDWAAGDRKGAVAASPDH